MIYQNLADHFTNIHESIFDTFKGLCFLGSDFHRDFATIPITHALLLLFEFLSGGRPTTHHVRKSLLFTSDTTLICRKNPQKSRKISKLCFANKLKITPKLPIKIFLSTWMLH